MDGILVPILVAASVGTFAWGLVAALTGAGRGERKRLQERLSGDGRLDFQGHTGGLGANGRSITIQLAVVGLPAFLAKRPFIQALNRRLLQAYPQRTLGKFLGTATGIAVGVGGLTLLVTANPIVGLLAG